MTAHRTRRALVATAAAAIAFLLGTVAPAAAHGGDHSTGPTNYSSQITDPGRDGLDWNVLGGDAYVELTNNTGEQVVVLGYQGEPYLRFAPGEGVFENAASPAAYLNQDRYGDVEMPAGVAADAPAQWRKVSDNNQFAWHDHRAHWMSRGDPLQVTADPDRTHLISSWTILLNVGTNNPEEVRVTGELRWLPDLAWWPPIVALTVVFVTAVGAVALATRPREGTWRPLARTAAGIIALVAAANVIRTIDELAAGSLSWTEMIPAIISAAVSLLAVIALCARGWLGHPGGFAAIALAAMMMMILFGGEAGGQLSAPVIETNLPDWVRRWTIAASYTAVAPALVVAAIAGRWYARDDTLGPSRSGYTDAAVADAGLQESHRTA